MSNEFNEKPVPSPRTKKNVLTREEIMSNLKLVPLPRQKFCGKLLEEQNIQRKNLHLYQDKLFTAEQNKRICKFS